MVTIGYLPVRSGETPMKFRFWLILASGHCPDPALHRRFADRDQKFAYLLPMENFLLQFSAYHRRVFCGSRITSCGSP
ncbi:hypothetical protein HAX54_022372, partial [Datura stramonium]|nr:hypothetical protein [Datura stramonium]